MTALMPSRSAPRSSTQRRDEAAKPVVGLAFDGAGGDEPGSRHVAIERVDLEQLKQRDDNGIVTTEGVCSSAEREYWKNEARGVGRKLKRSEQQVVDDGERLHARERSAHHFGIRPGNRVLTRRGSATYNA
ncbi:MAG: hypothetical protein ABW061_28035 [Polyangiaceae bacterium]